MNALRALWRRLADLPAGRRARRDFLGREAHAYRIDELRARVDALEANREAVFQILEEALMAAGIRTQPDPAVTRAGERHERIRRSGLHVVRSDAL